MNNDDSHIDDETTQQEQQEQQHLDWTSTQGYILTGGNKAEEYYTTERGFPFVEQDLPHYHLLKGDTHVVFHEWQQQQREFNTHPVSKRAHGSSKVL